MPSKRSSALIPFPAACTRTPCPSARSSSSSAPVSIASWSGCGTTFARGTAPFARRSVSRTDQPFEAASSASAARVSAPFACRIARPWPSLRSPLSSSSRAASGRSRMRTRLEIATRLRPSRRPSSSLVRPRSSTSAAQARASSTGFRSSRATFSISAVCIRVASSSSRMRAGTTSTPASRAARQRRSPAISSKRPSASGRTITRLHDAGRLDGLRERRDRLRVEAARAAGSGSGG